MIKLYHRRGTRSLRIVWLLEELGLDYEILAVPPAEKPGSFALATPSGKVPVIADGDLVQFESGAILEYLIERHGNGRLAPAVSAATRPYFLQWCHFAEATMIPPLYLIAQHTFLKPQGERLQSVVEDAKEVLGGSLRIIEGALADGREYLLGEAFSGADIMLGYSLLITREFGLIPLSQEATGSYLQRLLARAAFQRAQAI
jgi:glutathione S-transferase